MDAQADDTIAFKQYQQLRLKHKRLQVYYRTLCRLDMRLDLSLLYDLRGSRDPQLQVPLHMQIYLACPTESVQQLVKAWAEDISEAGSGFLVPGILEPHNACAIESHCVAPEQHEVFPVNGRGLSVGQPVHCLLYPMEHRAPCEQRPTRQ